MNDSAGKRQFGSPSTSQVATFSHQMLSAVAYIHHLSIAHRDIKPSNWLIRSKGSILPVLKLSDFGLASTFHPGELMSKICGSMIYMAPEVFWKSYTELCDIWSLGLVIQEIVCGKPLFGKLSKTAVEKNVCGSEINLDQMGWTCHGPWLKPWVQQMLVKESVGRPSALHALDHPQMHHAKQKSQGSCQCTATQMQDQSVDFRSFSLLKTEHILNTGMICIYVRALCNSRFLECVKKLFASEKTYSVADSSILYGFIARPSRALMLYSYIPIGLGYDTPIRRIRP